MCLFLFQFPREKTRIPQFMPPVLTTTVIGTSLATIPPLAVFVSATNHSSTSTPNPFPIHNPLLQSRHRSSFLPPFPKVPPSAHSSIRVTVPEGSAFGPFLHPRHRPRRFCLRSILHLSPLCLTNSIASFPVKCSIFNRIANILDSPPSISF